MKRVLVIQPAFIGDAIVSIALANALKRAEPSLEITYLVRPECASLIRYAPAISSVVEFDKYGEESGLHGMKEKATQLNRIGFDSVFCLHGSRRSLELVRRLSAAFKIGGVENSVFTRVVKPIPSDDGAMKAARLATALYPDADVSLSQSLALPDSLLPAGFESLKRPIVGIAPGSVWATKRWPAARYADLVESYGRQGVTTVLLGQSSDVDDALRARGKSLLYNPIDYLSKLSLEASAAVISRLDVLISNDSAPVHIAVATGTPVVDILGPTVREFGFAPRQQNGVVVELAGLWCRPCSTHGSNTCPIHSFDCMNGISVATVIDAARRYLSGSLSLGEF